MTEVTLREQIEAASAKATQAEHDRAYYGSVTLRPEEIAFHTILVNAYRAGKLIVIEDEADAVRRMRKEIEDLCIRELDWRDCESIATAALAALRGETA